MEDPCNRKNLDKLKGEEKKLIEKLKLITSENEEIFKHVAKIAT